MGRYAQSRRRSSSPPGAPPTACPELSAPTTDDFSLSQPGGPGTGVFGAYEAIPPAGADHWSGIYQINFGTPQETGELAFNETSDIGVQPPGATVTLQIRLDPADGSCPSSALSPVNLLVVE